jgi:hypothetical protein
MNEYQEHEQQQHQQKQQDLFAFGFGIGLTVAELCCSCCCVRLFSSCWTSLITDELSIWTSILSPVII